MWERTLGGRAPELAIVTRRLGRENVAEMDGAVDCSSSLSLHLNAVSFTPPFQKRRPDTWPFVQTNSFTQRAEAKETSRRRPTKGKTLANTFVAVRPYKAMIGFTATPPLYVLAPLDDHDIIKQ